MEGIRWKFVTVISIVAMAVSMLSGGLAGIGFGMLVMRALIGGVVFAVFGVGLNIFITRFFPELFEDGAGYESESEAGESGRNVDIVLPAENMDSPGEERADSEAGPPEEEAPEELLPANEPPDAAKAPGPGEEESGPLGDLDRFSEDFMEVEDESDGRRPAATDVPGGDREPQELAQAIQTVIKRDEKG